MGSAGWHYRTARLSQTHKVLKPYGFCFVGLFSGRVRFGITGAGITFTDAMLSDAKVGITGVGITLNDARVSDATVSITGVGITLIDAKGSDAKIFLGILPFAINLVYKSRLQSGYERRSRGM